MKFKKPKISFKDRRGEIIDILKKEPIEYVTLITSKKGAVRGNHFHKKSIQYNYVLKGKLKLFSKVKQGRVRSIILRPGDLALNPKGEEHAILAMEDSEFLVFTRGPRGGENYELDTYRLKGKFKLVE